MAKQMLTPGNRRLIRKKKKSWVERNMRWVAIIFAILFVFQSFRGCLNKTAHRLSEKELIKQRDSIYMLKDHQNTELQNLLEEALDENQRLIYELKIAGVKQEEAEKRARAIQETAQRIRQNTTIEIKADTSRNKINQIEK